jgi:uncharacterized phage infection (PIP) family protein YhgE
LEESMNINLNATIHLHYPADRALERIEGKVDDLLALGAQLLMVSQETKDVLDRVDAATTRIGTEVTEAAAEITKLKDLIATGMTSAEVADVNARLTATADSLKTAGDALDAIGSNPDQPVPPEA